MDNSKLRYWPILFLVSFVEGIIAIVWLGLIPPDANNSVFLGFSTKRLLMMAFIIVILVILAFLGGYSWRHRDWRERWLNPNRNPRLFRWLIIFIAFIALAIELILLYLRNYDPARLTPLYIRSEPLLGYLFLFCTQLAVLILVLCFGTDLKSLWSCSILLVFMWVSITLVVYSDI
jgi:hypothetical protein